MPAVRTLAAPIAALLLTSCEKPPGLERPRIRISNNINCATLVHHVKPQYPEEARRKGLKGTVRLNALITKLGTVRVSHVESGDESLAPAAINAVQQWRYTPCIIEGQPTELKTTLEVNFPP